MRAERVGALLGDLLDLHAALRAQHAEVLLRGAVEGERRVVLLRDVGSVLDPDALHDMTLDVEAEDVARVGARFVGVGGELHAAGLAATTDLDLRLHHDRVADAIGDGDGIVDRLRDLAVGDGNAVAGEQLLALVLEQIQRVLPRDGCGSETTGRLRSRADRGRPRASR